MARAGILDSLLEDASHFGGLRECAYDLNMPLAFNLPESPLACREPSAEFETVNASFSSQIRAFFEALEEFESQSTSPDGDEFVRKDGLRPIVRIINQSFDTPPPRAACTATSTPAASTWRRQTRPR